ncbi:MAG: hypothetical protein Q7S15_02135 [bacterium]|nr:hypothetical protein [bacterium]
MVTDVPMCAVGLATDRLTDEELGCFTALLHVSDRVHRDEFSHFPWFRHVEELFDNDAGLISSEAVESILALLQDRIILRSARSSQ